MGWLVTSEILESNLVSEVRRLSGVNVNDCYQCGKCSAGCPIAFAMDYLPNQIMRMVQLGLWEAVLNSKTIWLCASCETCTTRCPREVDLAEVMDTLRRIASKERAEGGERSVYLFDTIFLKTVEQFGRLFEVGLIGTLNLLSGHPFKNLKKGMEMFKKGKINLIPERIENRREIKEIFRRARDLEERERG